MHILLKWTILLENFYFSVRGFERLCVSEILVSGWWEINFISHLSHLLAWKSFLSLSYFCMSCLASFSIIFLILVTLLSFFMSHVLSHLSFYLITTLWGLVICSRDNFVPKLYNIDQLEKLPWAFYPIGASFCKFCFPLWSLYSFSTCNSFSYKLPSYWNFEASFQAS